MCSCIVLMPRVTCSTHTHSHSHTCTYIHACMHTSTFPFFLLDCFSGQPCDSLLCPSNHSSSFGRRHEDLGSTTTTTSPSSSSSSTTTTTTTTSSSVTSPTGHRSLLSSLGSSSSTSSSTASTRTGSTSLTSRYVSTELEFCNSKSARRAVLARHPAGMWPAKQLRFEWIILFSHCKTGCSPCCWLQVLVRGECREGKGEREGIGRRHPHHKHWLHYHHHGHIHRCHNHWP